MSHKMKKISITNLDDRHEIKLGPWCNLGDSKEIEYHWNDRNKLKIDYQYLKKLRLRILNHLKNILNKHNSIKLPLRSWIVIIDPALSYLISSLFDRWEVIRNVKDNFSYNFYEYNDNKFVFQDVLDVINGLSNNDNLNQYIFQLIINFQKKRNFKILKRYKKNNLKKNLKIKKSITSKNLKNIILNSLINRNETLFIDTYFSNRIIFKNTKFIQSKNYFIKNEFSNSLNRDNEIRIKLFDTFIAKNKFEDFLKKYLAYFLPNYFIENFKQNHLTLDSLGLENKHIFSSGLHHTNILLKFYIARCIQSKKGFFILEHGGSFPAIDYYFGYETDISNLILSWHKKINKNYLQLPAQKLIFKKKIIRKKKINHFILLNRVTRYTFRCEFYPMTGANKYLKEFCKSYYDELNNGISKKTFLKLHPADNDSYWKNYKYYKNISNSKIEKKEGLKEVFENSKLITCLYPETTFSECIYNNIPTILLYPKNFYERNKKFTNVINKLKDAKILFYNPIEAAKHINKIWYDVDKWWNSQNTKNAIKIFKKNILGINENDKDKKYWLDFVEYSYKDHL